ncbi:MAG: M20/M25/M40 family metallo-hydrolase [Elusimicrobia bacterium]|nr:M20/M25/M40 family metallo-hydrolase [Elusimicrobiota bacterium]
MRGLAAALLALAAVLPVRAEDGAARMRRETRGLLKDLVAFDTSNPPGGELPAALYLKGALEAGGVKAGVFTSTGSRASLIARVKGSGRKRPLLLMCHTDVVPADAKGWTTPPFVPTEKEGYLYGRGTEDIKSMCAAQAAVLLRLARERTRLDRDVVFFAEADEETGAAVRHIDWLTKNHGAELDAEFAVNEGGNTLWEGGRPSEMLIQAAEKEYIDVHLTARGSAGHASVPREDNAVLALSEGLRRLGALRWPAELNPVVRASFAYKAASAPEPVRSALEAVLVAAPGTALDEAAARLRSASPELGAMLSDTLTPTVVSGGYKSNVIPAEAKATLNGRMLPGHGVQAFLARIREALSGLPISVEHEFSGRASVPPMPVDNEFVAAAKRHAERLAPGIRVSPFMAVATTDAQDLRARGTLVYGIEPPFPPGDRARMHGDDERILLLALDWHVEHLWALVADVAGARP